MRDDKQANYELGRKHTSVFTMTQKRVHDHLENYTHGYSAAPQTKSRVALVVMKPNNGVECLSKSPEASHEAEVLLFHACRCWNCERVLRADI